ncbi:hypothetical protein BT69DRAFT_1341739 [Atractiella rhizophila]|nr:hypothetical protein BT69DRAFT_1341739 [Atractiella rhizophila]
MLKDITLPQHLFALTSCSFSSQLVIGLSRSKAPIELNRLRKAITAHDPPSSHPSILPPNQLSVHISLYPEVQSAVATTTLSSLLPSTPQPSDGAAVSISDGDFLTFFDSFIEQGSLEAESVDSVEGSGSASGRNSAGTEDTDDSWFINPPSSLVHGKENAREEDRVGHAA